MNVTFLIKQVEKHHQKFFIGLLVLWSAIQCLAWLHFGVKESCDSPQYYLSAKEMLEGIMPSGREFFYTSYISILAVLKLLGASKHAVVLLHVFCGFCSVIVLHKITYFLSKSKPTALFSMAVYVGWFKFQQWNLIIYTDALFVYFIMFSMAFLLFYQRGFLKVALAIPLIIFTTFFRPPGIGFLVALIGYFFLWKIDGQLLKSKKTWIVLAVAGVGGLVVINQFMAPFIGWIITGNAKVEIIYPNEALGFTAPDNLDIPSPDSPPLWQLISFFLFNFGFTLKLFCIRVGLFLGHMKPYYTWAHNLLIMGYLFPLYALCLYAFKTAKRTPLKFFIMTFLIFQTVTIGLTSENWDGRFLLPLLPWVFIFSGLGLQIFIKNKSLKNS